MRRNPLLREVADHFPEGFVSFDEYLQDECSDPVTVAALERARVRLAEDQSIERGGLTQLRLRAGLSQKELADKIGTSQPLLSGWERSKAKPSYENLHKLSHALNVDYNMLFEALG